jgi:hypothetical protein
MVRAQVPRIIRLGEMARVQAKGGWKGLSIKLAAGKGRVTQFVAEMQALVQWINQRIAAFRRTSWKRPTKK